MRPLRKPEIAAQVAEDLGMDQKTVLKIVNSYWNEVVEAVRQVRHINIRIHEVGELRIAKSKVQKYRDRIANKLRPGYTDDPFHRGLEKRLVQLDNILVLIKEEYAKREEVRNKRKLHDEAKKNLGEQVAHPGGSVDKPDDIHIPQKEEDSEGEA